MGRGVIVIAGKDPALIDGGSESYLRAYGRAARRAGYQPHFFSMGTGNDRQETEFGVIHRVHSPFRPFRGLMVAAHQPYLLRAVDRFVGNTAEAQLIHSFGPWGGVGLAAAQRLRRRGMAATAIVTPFGTYNHETRGKLRGLQFSRQPMRWLQHAFEFAWTRLTVDPNEGRGYRGSDLVLPNYDSVRQIITRRFGSKIAFQKMTYASEMAFLDPPLRELPAAAARLEPKDAPLIVAVSRQDPRKGVGVLIGALATLRERGLKFRACLVGGGQLLETHRALVERTGLSGSVVLPGRVPDAFSYLQHADIFVLPSLEEGSGSVSLLEAMQAGCAPIVSRVDGLPEDVCHGESALLVEPGDVSGLAEAIADLLTKPDVRAQIAAGARRQFEYRFSADAFAADLKRLYSGLGFAGEGTDLAAKRASVLKQPVG